MKRPPVRVWIAVMIFMTTFVNYMMRSNMSVSIISMTESKNKSQAVAPCLENQKQKNVSASTPAPTKVDDAVRYNWAEVSQGNILGAYFWGYVITTLPAGIIAETIGPWHTILWSSVLSAILTGLTPMSAKLGSGGVIVVRFLIGFLGGFHYPAINVLIARWAPPKEKGKFLAAMMGNTLGTVITWLLVAQATDSLGWEWGFYVLVIVMVFYCLVFAVVVTDSPQKHWCITEEEQKFIAESQEGKVSTTKAVPPYKKIFLSIPFLALCAAQFGNLWGLNLILTFAPKFMKQTMGYDIKSSTAVAAAPYIARLLFSLGFGVIGDHMRKKEIMTVTKLRKFFIIFSHFLPAAMLFLLVAAGCNKNIVVPLLILNQGFNGAVVVSHLVNCQDLSPNFAGTLYGTMNLIASTTGFIVPPISGAFMDAYNKNITAGFYIFSIGGVMFACGGLIFVMFGSGEVQPWNEKKADQQEET